MKNSLLVSLMALGIVALMNVGCEDLLKGKKPEASQQKTEMNTDTVQTGSTEYSQSDISEQENSELPATNQEQSADSEQTETGTEADDSSSETHEP